MYTSSIIRLEGLVSTHHILWILFYKRSFIYLGTLNDCISLSYKVINVSPWFFFNLPLTYRHIYSATFHDNKKKRSRMMYFNIDLDCVYLPVRPLWNSLTHKTRKAILWKLTLVLIFRSNAIKMKTSRLRSHR